jgi:hypothetical protein
MRPVLAVDLICAGRAVLRVRPDAQDMLARRLIETACIADRYRLAEGVAHPEFGDGTLASAARHAGLVPEPEVGDVRFARALICVLEAVIAGARVTHRSGR